MVIAEDVKADGVDRPLVPSDENAKRRRIARNTKVHQFSVGFHVTSFSSSVIFISIDGMARGFAAENSEI
jgi:hypothetical protein